MRVDLYTTIHKAQRFHLFVLAADMSRTDFNNQLSSIPMVERLQSMLHHLRDHAKNEETYIHPLFRQVGQYAEVLGSEHQDLETEIDQLEAILKQKRWQNLYPKFMDFLMRYLVHLAEEEKAQREVLWPNFDDKKLGEVFMRFKTERRPQDAKEDLKFMIPALSIPELMQIFKGMKAAAPEPVFRSACDLAAIIDPLRWKEIKAELDAA